MVEFSDLATLAKRTDPAAQAATNQQIRLLGGIPTDHTYHPKDSSSDLQRIDAPDATKYKVAEFDKLIADLSDHRIGYEEQRAAAKRWLHHWKVKGRAMQALNAIRGYLDATRTSQSSSIAEELLNDAFDASLGVEDREESYRWLVRAHVARHGWQSNWTSETEINRRLDAAAKHFPEKWKEYIHDTSDQAPYWERAGFSFAIDYRYLVRFLLLVEQKELAFDLTKNFVEILVAEVSDQPLPPCPWYR